MRRSNIISGPGSVLFLWSWCLFLLLSPQSLVAERITESEFYTPDLDLAFQPIQENPGQLSLKDTLLQEPTADAVAYYQRMLDFGETSQKIHASRQMAFLLAQEGKAEAATNFVTQYLNWEFRPEVLADRNFDPIRNEAAFQEVVEAYLPEHSFWSYLYIYIGLIGIFIVSVICFQRKAELGGRLLIGGFVFIHSIFILHIALAVSNYQYEIPHSYLSSTVFSFLYGPLLYFYFKRSAQGYTFKVRDLLHLVPTLILLGYLIPIYGLSAAEKLDLMLSRYRDGLNPSDSANLVLIVSLKLTSLVIYGWLIRRHFPQIVGSAKQPPRTHWEQNIYRIHVAYIICYAIYGGLIIYRINSGPFYHAQVISMALMVLYVGYFASLKPEVFGSTLAFQPLLFSKYKKSGLTPSFSKELRDQLTKLFEQEKIYRENDLNLDRLADLLDTTRHNTSQVINEHFKVSFHELINTYRIAEAKELLRNDPQGNLQIIDIVYEVGYNNKVSFNKAFKKDTGLTPSAFQERAAKLEVKRA
ncbi:Helix-turn-helix domain-containing protein [Robiginitalea myxolifaciens]|uniref:Helix-turn-helix domain-containing protein n=1 Tax=Robiginitalea myxolifaciens TaxID=400055 RepID=A0A1I6HA81_9FLAO|nr:helix-turn-helix domain-containing protein [Robiginitalea myxolifaciens]SFR51244.1 Helix-turn-helix domain-containing protein [Robiginitalea myxolifaciens]